MAFRYIWFSLGFLAFSITPMASAKILGPELSISPQGEVHAKNVELTIKNALNLFSLNVWGLNLLVNIDRFTVLESADGKPLSLEDIQLGHFLEIKGRAASTRDGLMDTRLVRDLSIGTPPPLAPQPREEAPAPAPPIAAAAGPVILPPPAPQPAPRAPAEALTGNPPPANTSSITARRLTQQLYFGMRGGEVVLLQQFLQKNGWGIPDNGPVTGYYGTVTAKAVKKFQAAHDLEPIGEVGPKTRALINEIIGR